MDWQHQQPDGEADALDRLLAEAHWAEPTPEAIGRLRDRWQSLVAGRLRRRRRRLLTLAAAAMLAGVGLSIWTRVNRTAIESTNPTAAVGDATSFSRQACRPRLAASVPHDGQTCPPSGVSLAARSPAAGKRALSGSRPPSPYELAMRSAYRRARSLRQQRPTDESAAAAVEQPCKSPHAGELTQNEDDTGLQQERLSALLARGDLRSVNIFLDRVEDPKTAAAALDCLARAPNPPVYTLLGCLHDSRAGRRMAAARALGRLNQPAVSRELIAMAIRGVHRQEAMIALLASSEPTAQQFLAAAARNPNFSAALWNAQRQFQTTLMRRS
jgi:hypothetical protein